MLFRSAWSVMTRRCPVSRPPIVQPHRRTILEPRRVRVLRSHRTALRSPPVHHRVIIDCPRIDHRCWDWSTMGRHQESERPSRIRRVSAVRPRAGRPRTARHRQGRHRPTRHRQGRHRPTRHRPVRPLRTPPRPASRPPPRPRPIRPHAGRARHLLLRTTHLRAEAKVRRRHRLRLPFDPRHQLAAAPRAVRPPHPRGLARVAHGPSSPV